MNLSAVYAVLITLACVGAAVLIYRFIGLLASAQRTLVATNAHLSTIESQMTGLSAAIEKMRDALEPCSKEMQVNMAAVPKLLEMVAKIGSAQLEIMQQRTTQQNHPNPFGRPNAPRGPRDTAGANLEYEVDQLMRAEGISRQEAELRLNPANAGSVWEGSNFFENWR